MRWFFKVSIFLLSVLLIWLGIAFALPWVLPEQKISDTSIHGLQFKNEVWSGNIEVDGDLITLPGANVKVLPGTKIIINRNGDKSNFDFLPWHLKSGLNSGNYYHGVYNGELFWDESNKIQLHFSNLEALGTKQQPIIISSNSPTSQESPFDINSINIKNGILANVIASNYRRLEVGDNVSVRDSSFGNISECSICIEDGSPNIINNTFGNSLRESIWVGGASPKITDNIFNPSKGAGIVIDPKSVGAATISHNDFEMPGDYSIYIISGDEIDGGVISFNNFVGSSQIRLSCDSKINLAGNNLQAVISFQSGGCAQTYTFGPNYWGTKDISTILKERILKKDQKLNIIIGSTLSEPPSDVGPRK